MSFGGANFKAEKGRAFGDYSRALDAVRGNHESKYASKTIAATCTERPIKSDSRTSDNESTGTGCDPSGLSGSSDGRPQTASSGVIAKGV